jgi:hypothetical protein
VQRSQASYAKDVPHDGQPNEIVLETPASKQAMKIPARAGSVLKVPQKGEVMVSSWEQLTTN